MKCLHRTHQLQQTKFIIEKIEKALVSAGATPNDVVRTRRSITDMSRWDEIGRAHGEYFREIKPALTWLKFND